MDDSSPSLNVNNIDFIVTLTLFMIPKKLFKYPIYDS